MSVKKESNKVGDGVPVLWEILLPTIRPSTGRPIRTRQHKVWDAKVRAISGGLTIHAPVKGQWVAPNTNLFKERMIPVRICCTLSQIREIMKMSRKFYEQQVIMAYRISDLVLWEPEGVQT